MMKNFDPSNMDDERIRRILNDPLEGDPSWAEPGEEVWNRISDALDTQPRRRGFAWWWWGGAFLVGILGLFLWTGSGDPSSGETMPSSDRIQNLTSPVKAAVERPTPEDSGSASTTEEPLQMDQGLTFDQVLTPTARPRSAMDRENSSLADQEKTEAGDRSGFSTTPQPPAGAAFPEVNSEVLPALTGADLMTGSGEDLFPIPDHKRMPGLTALPLIQPGLMDSPEGIRLPDAPDPAITSFPKPLSSGSELAVWVHGWGADRNVERKTPIGFIDPEIRHTNENYRIGLGYTRVFRGGWLLGGGAEIQEYREFTEREKVWVFSKKNAEQTSAGVFEQSIPIVLNTGFGTATATLRVDIDEGSSPKDYQEGDKVLLQLGIRHKLTSLRFPVYAGYRYTRGPWSAEVQGGAALQWLVGSSASIERIMEERDLIRIQGRFSSQKLRYLREQVWDVHGSLLAGYAWNDHWRMTAGVSAWQSLNSMIDRENVSTYTCGIGLQLGVCRKF